MRAPIFAVFLTIASAMSLRVTADGAAGFLCEGMDNGSSAATTFRLLAGEQEIASGPCGLPRTIPAGSYEALFVLDGAIDTPLRREPIEAQLGQTAEVQINYETGELVVEVTRGGRRSVGMVRVLRNGKPIASVGAGSANRLSTGSYGIEVESRGENRRLEAVTIVRGERRVLVADFAEVSGKSSQ